MRCLVFVSVVGAFQTAGRSCAWASSAAWSIGRRWAPLASIAARRSLSCATCSRALFTLIGVSCVHRCLQTLRMQRCRTSRSEDINALKQLVIEQRAQLATREQLVQAKKFNSTMHESG